METKATTLEVVENLVCLGPHFILMRGIEKDSEKERERER